MHIYKINHNEIMGDWYHIINADATLEDFNNLVENLGNEYIISESTTFCESEEEKSIVIGDEDYIDMDNDSVLDDFDRTFYLLTDRIIKNRNEIEEDVEEEEPEEITFDINYNNITCFSNEKTIYELNIDKEGRKIYLNLNPINPAYMENYFMPGFDKSKFVEKVCQKLRKYNEKYIPSKKTLADLMSIL